MIRRILVALDASPFATTVIDAAAEIALKFDAAVIPLRVISLSGRPSRGEARLESFNDVFHPATPDGHR